MSTAPRRTTLSASRSTLLAVAASLLATATPVPASVPAGRVIPLRSPTPHRATSLDVARHIDVNRINMYTTNVGSFAHDVTTGNAGLIWPRGLNQAAVLGSGLWLGARVNGQVRVALAEFYSEYGPGGMVGRIHDDPNRPEHRVYKVARWTGDPADSSHVERTPAELTADPRLDPLDHHAWSEYIAGAKPFGAPTRIHRLPLTSTPQPDDSVDVEGPDVLGDRMLWEVHNDANPANHDPGGYGGTAPLGVEVQQTTFAFDRSDELGNVVFLRFRIINKGTNVLDDMYVSVWSDPDVGDFTDDLVGCDVSRDLGFAYNSDESDGVYGSSPPAVGYALLRGTADPNTGLPLPMSAFSKLVDADEAGSFQDIYNLMQGLHADGSPLIDPTTNQPTRYAHPGDPVSGQGWFDAATADRVMLLTSGPGRMLPGEEEEVWAAIVVGRGADRLASITAVRCLADLARDAYQRGFSALPVPAPTCSGSTPALVSLVSAEASTDRVALRWYAAEPGFTAAVERRVAGEDWIEVGRVVADGDGHLVFEDRDLVPGWYDYRLAVAAGGVVEYGGHARVEVGAHAVLAFLGSRVGPGDRRLVISFALEGREPARLEMLDIAGRRLVARDLADPAPGEHTLDLEAPARLSAGIYLVRITQGAQRVAGKAAVVR